MPVYKLDGTLLTNADAATTMANFAANKIPISGVRVPPSGAVVENVDLSGLVLDNSTCSGLQMKDGSLANARITETVLEGTSLDNFVLDGAAFSSIVYSGTIRAKSSANCVFQGSCDLRAVKFFGDVSGISVVGGDLGGASFAQSSAPKAILSDCKCAGLTLSHEQLRATAFDVNIRELTGQLLMSYADTAARRADCAIILGLPCNAASSSDLWTKAEFFSSGFHAWAFPLIQTHLDTVGGERSVEIKAVMESVLNG